jgi:hypothetical protein
MGFAVYHVQKGKNQASSLGYHIDRKEGKEACYKHADPSKKHLNKEFITKFDKGMNLQEKINLNIKNYYTSSRQIRSDAVKHLSHILTGTHEDMKRIFNDKELKKKWIESNFDFMQKEFGYQNIVSFTLHLDEKTPHIHCITTPITKDGRLSASEIVGNNKNLERLQDSYCEMMKPFGLERGLKSTAKHIPTKEYYKLIQSGVTETKQIKNDLQFDTWNKKSITNSIEQIFDKNNISVFSIEKDKITLKNAVSDRIEKVIETINKRILDDSIKLKKFTNLVDEVIQKEKMESANVVKMNANTLINRAIHNQPDFTLLRYVNEYNRRQEEQKEKELQLQKRQVEIDREEAKKDNGFSL